MWLVGERPIGGIDVGDQLVDEDALKPAEIERKPASPGTAAARGPTRDRGGGGTRLGRRGGATGPTAAAAAADPAAVVHHDDDRLGLTGGDQVVHDQVGMPLVPPP